MGLAGLMGVSARTPWNDDGLERCTGVLHSSSRPHQAGAVRVAGQPMGLADERLVCGCRVRGTPCPTSLQEQRKRPGAAAGLAGRSG